MLQLIVVFTLQKGDGLTNISLVDLCLHLTLSPETSCKALLVDQTLLGLYRKLYMTGSTHLLLPETARSHSIGIYQIQENSGFGTETESFRLGVGSVWRIFFMLEPNLMLQTWVLELEKFL